jgi:chromate transporter
LKTFIGLEVLFLGEGMYYTPMLDQYVARPTAPKFVDPKLNIIRIDRSELLTGAGIVRAIPGPVFSIASFTGGMALKDEGTHSNCLDVLLASVAIFLPSVLLILFFFPVWQYLKNLLLFTGRLKVLTL